MHFDWKELEGFQTRNYIILCTACAKADYTPANWETFLGAMKIFPFDFYMSKYTRFDWAQFALDLDQLGLRDLILMRKIVNSNHVEDGCYDPAKVEKLNEILQEENVHNELAPKKNLGKT